MSTDHERKILNDMEKSGFFLEIDVLNSLMQKGWAVFPQYSYSDVQSGKIRAIDMIANPLDYVLDQPKLIIECKYTSDKSWIFFIPPVVSTDKNKDLNSINATILYSHIAMEFSLGKHHPNTKQNPNDIKNALESVSSIRKGVHFFKREVPCAYSCYVHPRQNDEEANDFRKAILQLNSAFLGAKFVANCPVFLCLVFRGEMLAIDCNKRIRPIDHVIFVNLSEDSGEKAQPPAFIDIVKDTFFENYLEIIKSDMEICMGIKPSKLN